METRGLATDYGSPIYRGRTGRRMPQSSASCGGAERSCLARPRRRRSRTARRPDAQPSQPGAHAGGKLERVGSRRGGRNGAGRPRNADRGIGGAAGVLLRRDRIQGELRASLHGGRAPLCDEPRHAGVLHAYASRHARALGVDGTCLGAGGRISPLERRTRCPRSSRAWRRRFVRRFHGCGAPEWQSGRLTSPECWPCSTRRPLRSCSTRPRGSIISAMKSTAHNWRIWRTWFAKGS